MFPALPSKPNSEINQLVFQIIKSSAALGKGLSPIVLDEVARFMTKINSYYTNAMEGNPSKLKDIDAALNNSLAKSTSARNFQLEHVAHIQVQNDMIQRLQQEPGLHICSQDFLCWLHEQFYLKLPPEMRFAKTTEGKRVPVIPGQLRDRGITVGAHDAPERTDEIIHYLNKFEDTLDPEKLAEPQKTIGMASSHHRLLWIHPFSDGNGRVARLFTTAYGYKIGLGDSRLWTVTRAFARNRGAYDTHLAMADQPRRNDWDGRGPLSEENLEAFCLFFLRSCKDQIDFMAEMLNLENVERRSTRYVDMLAKEKIISKAGAKVFENLFRQGQIPRAKVRDLCHVKQRRATQIIKELLDTKSVRSDTPYGTLKLNLSAEMATDLFPKLT
jgi:Fic family protein